MDTFDKCNTAITVSVSKFDLWKHNFICRLKIVTTFDIGIMLVGKGSDSETEYIVIVSFRILINHSPELLLISNIEVTIMQY